MVDSDTKAKPDTTSPADRATRLARAEVLVKDHMIMSAAAGLIPAPMLDLAASLGIQLALIKRLCTLYGVTFSENAARAIVLSLFGSVGAGTLAAGVFLSVAKLIPGAGTLMGAISMPIAMSAVTYAVGKVFIAHLELGGALLDFDPAANRAYFKEMVRRGRAAAAELAGTSTTAKPSR